MFGVKTCLRASPAALDDSRVAGEETCDRSDDLARSGRCEDPFGKLGLGAGRGPGVLQIGHRRVPQVSELG